MFKASGWARPGRDERAASWAWSRKSPREGPGSPRAWLSPALSPLHLTLSPRGPLLPQVRAAKEPWVPATPRSRPLPRALHPPSPGPWVGRGCPAPVSHPEKDRGARAAGLLGRPGPGAPAVTCVTSREAGEEEQHEPVSPSLLGTVTARRQRQVAGGREAAEPQGSSAIHRLAAVPRDTCLRLRGLCGLGQPWGPDPGPMTERGAGGQGHGHRTQGANLDTAPCEARLQDRNGRREGPADTVHVAGRTAWGLSSPQPRRPLGRLGPRHRGRVP